MTRETLGDLVDRGEPVTLIFELVRQLAERRGYQPIGFRRIVLPDGFVVTVNGTKAPRHDETPEGEPGLLIPPFRASVWCGGLPCGLFGMFDGTLVFGTEARLIRALRTALEES